MSKPTTELVFFDNYNPEKEEHAASLEALSKQEGFVRVFHSKQVEDETVGVWAVDWEDLSFHQSFMKKEIYQPFVGEIMKFSSGPSKLIHVAFNSTTAFEAPVTEVLSLILNENANRKDVEEALDGVITRLLGVKGTTGPTYGVTVENADEYVLICGWESVEAHYAAPRNEKTGAVIKANATGKMMHGTFKAGPTA